MSTPLESKSTTEEIRARFDADVERFSNLETGQQAILDAALILDLVARGSTLHLRPGSTVLDIGCGAGNFTLRVLGETAGLHCHLADLSAPMLDRARLRVSQTGRAASIKAHQGDFRDLDFPAGTFDAILAGAVLHHLRDDEDWKRAFAQLHRWLKPGGRLYVSDLVCFALPDVQAVMWARYGDYLTSLGGEAYREKVFAYIEKEDSPRPLQFQAELLSAAGFTHWDVLHRNSVFACYVAVK
ncbi:MAG: class I SAM-dependent methyltransferase [Chthoniobacteraceae bacterium]